MKNTSFLRNRQGFTLVELAIVLVIISLIVGAILSGQSLLRNQKVRAVATDAKTYRFAARQFVEQYGYLPGDMPTAQRIWGNATGGAYGTSCAAGATEAAAQTAATPQATCNGDGNGFIRDTPTRENYRAWQQLAAAGLITGSYSGISGAAPYPKMWYNAGVNSPVGSMASSTYAWHSGLVSNVVIDTISGDFDTFFDGDYANMLWFGVPIINNSSGQSPTLVLNPALAGKEAYSLDVKSDDGLPALGYVRSIKSTSSYGVGCTTSDVAASARYSITNSLPLCPIFFLDDLNKPK